MKNIHVLPTENYKEDYKLKNSDAVIQVVKLGQLIFDSSLKVFRINKNQIWAASCDTDVLIPHHIYITSDEEPKPNDYYFDFENQKVKKCETGYYNKGSKKIILTTDQDLIKDGVQAINDEFLEWFVKNPSCEEVELTTYHVKKDISGKLHYKIIVSKEKPKQRLEKYSERFDNKDNELAEGIFNPDTWGKRVVEEHIDTLDMGQIPPKKEPKQETLEEFAKRYATDMSGTYYEDLYNAVIFGAKWQSEQLFKDDAIKTLEKGLELLLKKQETMYSKEEVLEIVIKCPYILPTNIKNWFKQLKKK